MMLIRVVAPHFVAGVEFDGRRVVCCAPILHRHIKGKTGEQIRDTFDRLGWRASVCDGIAVVEVVSDG